MQEFLKKYGKIFLGALFILLALTPILINPTLEILVAVCKGTAVRTGDVSMLWKNISIPTWITACVYLALGVQFIIQKLFPATTPPNCVYAIIFGVFAVWGVISCVTNVISLIEYAYEGSFTHWDSTQKARWLLSIFAGFFHFIGYALVAVVLLLKSKSKIFAFAPIVFFAIGAVLNIVSYILYIIFLSKLVDLFYFPPSYPLNIIYSILFVVMMALFCYLFLAISDEQETEKAIEPSLSE